MIALIIRRCVTGYRTEVGLSPKISQFAALLDEPRARKLATDAFENLSDDQRAAKPVNVVGRQFVVRKSLLVRSFQTLSFGSLGNSRREICSAQIM
jgi:hypothetical protein